MFVVIRNHDLKPVLDAFDRQYLAGNLSRPQAITHFHTPDVEIGITSYQQFTAEAPHTHNTATEFQYMLSGWTQYLDLDSREEHEFQTGDFFVITPGTTYAQKSKPGTRILFIKSPSLNDKELVRPDDQTVEWLATHLQTVRKDYFHEENAPSANTVMPAVAVAAMHDNQVLLIQRADSSYWTLPGGTLDFNESLPACAVREFHEETGLDVELIDMVGTYTDPDVRIAYSDGEVRREFTIVYLGQVADTRVILDEESLAHVWVPLSEWQTYPMAASQKRRLQDLSCYLESGKTAMR